MKKKITLKRRRKFVDVSNSNSKSEHPQGKKISKDLYQALTIIAGTFASKFILDNNIPLNKQTRVKVLYMEKFKRFFKERDFLNTEAKEVKYFDEAFVNDPVYDALMKI